MIEHLNIKTFVITMILAVSLVLANCYFSQLIGMEAVYAEEDIQKFNVKFNANGGKCSTSSKTVTKDNKYGKLPEPTKSRAYFKGWYTAKTSGKKIEASSTVSLTSNTTLYAHWKKATKLKYKFNANGGKVNTKSKSYKYNSKIKKLPKPKRSKYVFMGWYTKSHAGTKIYNGKKVTSTKTEQTLYARWAPKQYFQHNSKWANKSYGKGSTIARSGCGPSTMSMVVATLKKGSVTPAVAAKWSVNNGYKTNAPGKTKDGFFVKFPKKYKITSTRLNTGNIQGKSKSKAKKYHAEAKKAVENGDWVVALMNPGAWTHHGHFILWYDIEGSRALVRDPNAKKASKTRNKVSTLQSQVKRYWIISVPYSKMISPPTQGKVKGINTLTVRSSTSTSYTSLGSLVEGNKVTITNKKNKMWKIEYKGKTGYVPQKYIVVTK